MENDVLSFAKVAPNNDLIDQIWTFDVSTLDSMADITISKYTIALAQWLVYYRAQVNIQQAKVNKLKSDLEIALGAILTPELIKERGNKTAAVSYLISTDRTIGHLDTTIRRIKDDLVKVEGIDRAVSELIAAFKRELTRRENELYTTRKERYSK